MEDDDSIIIWSTSEPGVRLEALFDREVGSDRIDLVKYGPNDEIIIEYHGSIEALRVQNEVVQRMYEVRRKGQEG